MVYMAVCYEDILESIKVKMFSMVLLRGRCWGTGIEEDKLITNLSRITMHRANHVRCVDGMLEDCHGAPIFRETI